MRTLKKLLTAVFLYFFIFTTPSTAHIASLNLRSNNRQMIPISDFEFTNVGHVSFVLSSITVTSTSSQASNESRIGFFLQSRDDEFYLYTRETRNQDIFEFKQNTITCPLDFKSNSSVLFTFQNHGPQFSFNKSFAITYSGINSLFFINCNNESLVTIEGHAELYNLNDGNGNGANKNFLSAGLTKLPFLYIIFSFSYLTLLGFWILVCFKNRRIFNRTHLLMGGLLVVNCVHFMCITSDLHYVKITGSAHGLDVVFYIFQLTRAVIFSTVIVLISAGWFFWKPFLKREEKLVLMIVIVLEVWGNVDPILPWEAAVPYNKENGSFADVIYIFAIFFPMALSIASLNKIRETDLNAERNVGKLWLIVMLTIVYVLITKILLLALPTRWEINVVKETTIFMFCMLMLCIFRPVDRTRVANADETGLSNSNANSCFDSPV